jgi:hypothetical protein
MSGARSLLKRRALGCTLQYAILNCCAPSCTSAAAESAKKHGLCISQAMHAAEVNNKANPRGIYTLARSTGRNTELVRLYCTAVNFQLLFIQRQSRGVCKNTHIQRKRMHAVIRMARGRREKQKGGWLSHRICSAGAHSEPVDYAN